MASPNFGNDLYVIHATYDFTVSGGAVGAIALIGGDGVATCQIQDGALVLSVTPAVETACTSGGAATIRVDGATSGAMTAATGVASYAINAGLPLATTGLYSTAAQALQITIATAALTAGRVHYYFLCTNAFV